MGFCELKKIEIDDKQEEERSEAKGGKREKHRGVRLE